MGCAANIRGCLPWRLKRLIALTLAISLLEPQQGFFISQALAGSFQARGVQSSAITAPSVPAIGDREAGGALAAPMPNLAVGDLGTLSALPVSAPLEVPAAALTGEPAPIALPIPDVAAPLAAPGDDAPPRGAVAAPPTFRRADAGGSVSGGERASAPFTAKVAAMDRAINAPQSISSPGHWKHHFDGALESAGQAGDAAPVPGAAPGVARASGLASAPDPRARLKELRQVLGDGPLGEEPFGFFAGSLPFERAPGVGLEGFLYQKLRRQGRAGPETAQLGNFFTFLDGLLVGPAWAGERAALAALKASGGKPEELNARLDEHLLDLTARLRGELRDLDPALEGRRSQIYMVLARAYRKRQPGQTIFDVLDEAELSRIRAETGSNTLWLLDIFEIGEVNRWGVAGGSPYAIKGYHVKPEHGGDEALKAFVRRAHAAGLKVMVDYIPNHYALDSEALQKRPEAFIHLLPPQPSAEERGNPALLDAYKRRILAAAPKEDSGNSLYHLLEADYPEGNGRARRFILVQHPFEWGYKWVDMAQIDYSHPAARAWQVAEARRLFGDVGIDGVRRDMSYFDVNDRFFGHWLETLRWERDRAGEPWVREALQAQIAGLESRRAAVGGREFLAEMDDAIRAINPGALIIDEVYDHQRDVSRAGSNALYNKVGLYDALISRNPDSIRAALWDAAFRRWQYGAAAYVNFPANHDAMEGNPVDKFGPQAEAVLANTLLLRPSLFYNGLELMVGREKMLLRDGTPSEDDGRPNQKMIPFDANAWINWAEGDPARRAALARMRDFAARNADLLQDGTMEVLEPRSGSRALTAWTVGGAGRAILVASNWAQPGAKQWAKFQFGTSGLNALGVFQPRPDRDYVLKDWANVDAQGRPTEYRHTGKELAEAGLDVGLDGGGVHLFEIEEAGAPAAAPKARRTRKGSAQTEVIVALGAAVLIAGGVAVGGAVGWIAAGAVLLLAAAVLLRDPLASLYSRLKAWWTAKAPASAPMPLDAVEAFISEPGKETIRGKLTSIVEAVQGDPALAAALNKQGKARLIINVDKKNPRVTLTEADAPRIEGMLREHGVRVKVEIERLPVDWERHAKRMAAGKDQADPAVQSSVNIPLLLVSVGVWVTLFHGTPLILGAGVALFLALETIFLTRTMLASLSKPTIGEIGGGLVTKMLPFFTSVLWVWVAALSGHPLLLAVAIAFMLAQESFHGFFLDTWNNFVNNLNKLRGGAFLVGALWLYGLVSAAFPRLLAHLADPSKAPPWSEEFIFSILKLSLIGAFFGTLGFRGLNKLYEIGAIKRWQRSAFQQVQDGLMILAGPFLATGSMLIFWTIFWAQQGLAFLIFLSSLNATPRPIPYFVDPALMETAEFKAKYPISSGPQESPVQQALKAILDNPFIWPVVLPVKAVLGAIARRRAAAAEERKTRAYGLRDEGERR